MRIHVWMVRTKMKCKRYGKREDVYGQEMKREFCKMRIRVWMVSNLEKEKTFDNF
jgi:hypothetical protein